jgi:hypothetical protein
MKVEGLKITKVLDTQSGTSKLGKEWSKLTFVGETEEEYNNLYAFELFGKEKVENFGKFNKVGDLVNVEFNVSTREWEGKYFTGLQAWRIDKAQDNQGADDVSNHDMEEELPF